ncbi:proteasome subunit alpha type 6 [Plasmodium cynomolgi strain B]|uniref:Proteasome subunit alpha type 6 n=1 Tax=Plasmodium cynomolgi (strain B) TaxID=1120755 RepID=K6UPF1_PLACD|nr:proteasome subunit alpha type 6 [Plasmodium cynomolgi strain B]GAB64464.1 proteasome subunit alpha type 6 [Plasmodium cynomolgi strain B]
MVRQSQSMYDRHLTIFSPDGNLYQIEYAIKAVKNTNITSIGVKGENCAVIISQKKMATQYISQDKLLDYNNITNIYNITDEIGCSMVGMPGDCLSMVYKARIEAAEFLYSNGHNVNVETLCRNICDKIQVFTQHAYMRLHACSGMIIGMGEDNKPGLFKFDPSGFCAGYRACVIGNKEQESISILERLLEKRKKKIQQETLEEDVQNTIILAIEALQTILAFDLKANEIEMAIVSKANPNFTQISEKEIDNYLTFIAERD